MTSRTEELAAIRAREVVRKVRPLEDRFWEKVDKNGPIPEHRPELGPCWLWTGSKSRGYGSISKGSRGEGKVQAHRYTFEQEYGPIPEGTEPDHLCRNRACVRPTHLEVVTHRENVLRGAALLVEVFLADTCKRGHTLSENRGQRSQRLGDCKECVRIRDAARRRRLGIPAKPVDTCARGHPRTPENTYVRRDQPNTKTCLVCKRERSRATAR